MNVFKNLPTLLSFARLFENEQDRQFRQEPREPLSAPATLVPVNEELVVVDDPIDIVTWDISAKGVAVIMDSAPEHDLYAVGVSIGVEEHFLLCSVSWRDARDPFVLVGLEVVRILESLPTYGTERQSTGTVDA